MKNRPVYGRIPVDYAPIQDLSIDIKTMPQAFGGYHLLPNSSKTSLVHYS